ncbi:MAG: hypothetical protein LC108_09370 [Anaerolineales bacterium]|nr:hypothetical protein [Anaerolineales bacterium]
MRRCECRFSTRRHGFTGFGLLGHSLEMAQASQVALEFEFAKLPFLSGAKSYVEKGIFPGGAFDNKKHFGEKVHIENELSEALEMLLYDPQTSGGLLLGVPQIKLAEFETRAAELGQSVWVIGKVQGGSGIYIR